MTFVEADAASLPFEDGSFDLAAAVRTLHHVPVPSSSSPSSRASSACAAGC